MIQAYIVILKIAWRMPQVFVRLPRFYIIYPGLQDLVAETAGFPSVPCHSVYRDHRDHVAVSVISPSVAVRIMLLRIP